MPSRRDLLTALAAARAGCTVGPGTPTESNSPAESPSQSPTDSATVGFDPVVTENVPADATILVASPTWRRWLRQAADGSTVRGSADPPDCGRAPLDDVEQLRLVDTDRSGTYDVTLEDGGYYEYPFDAAPADPPSGATVYDLDDLQPAVATRFVELIDSGSERLVPQGEPFQFVDEHSRDSSEYAFLLYVRRDGTVYRISANIPTITPPCGYYVVLTLSPTGSASESTTFSLARLESPATLADALDEDTTPSLSSFPERTRALLQRYDYVLGLAECYRVVITR